MTRKLQITLVLFLCGLLNAAIAQEFVWPVSTPEAEQIDPDMINTLVQRIQAGTYGNQKSLLILRHGKIVHEQYFGSNQQNDLMPMYSATKSWGSALIGQAIRNGDLESVDTPIEQIFVDYPQPFQSNQQKQDITMRDILTMRNGLAWDEWSTFFTDPANPVNQMTKAGDWWRFVLDRPMTAATDSVFRYSTGVSNLMGGAIYQLTQMSALEYSIQHLFEPMDINDYYVEVDISGAPRGTGIRNFQTGLTPTGHGLWLTTRDMAKLGQLYLDDGVWQSRRLIDSQWIKDSWGQYSNHDTDPQVFGEGVSYGYQWWNFEYQTEAGTVPVHLAWGWAEQFIFVIPSLDVVVVTTANNGSWSGENMRTAIKEIILDGIKADFDPVSDGGMSGTWYSQQMDSQGFLLEVVPSTGQVTIFWATYDPESSQQLWLVAVGLLHNRRAVLEFLKPEGGTFAGAAAATLISWGDVELTFQSCTTAQLNFLSEVAGVEGLIDLVRLTPVTTCTE